MIESLGECGRVRCEPGWSLASAWSRRLADHDLWYVWAGRGRMELRGGRVVPLFNGVLIWARPGGVYLAEQDPDDRLGVTYIHFTPRPGVATPGEVHLIRDPAYYNAVSQRVVELHAADAPGIAACLLDGLARDVASGRCTRDEQGGGTPRHHEQVARAVAAELRERVDGAPDIAALARRHGYSPDHLTRVFSDVLGQTPRDYVIEQRIGRARRLLDESPMTVAQIADALGYSSSAHLCRQFKQRVGQTPNAYRGRRPAF